MTDTSDTRTITLTRSEAKWFVDSALSAASTDDVTPVICGALITVTGESARIVSTDRYRVTLTTAKVESSEDHEFIMPRAAIVWMGRNLAAFGAYMRDYQRVVITSAPDGPLKVSVLEGTTLNQRRSLSWEGFVTKGHYPPVHKLFDTARAAEVDLTQVPSVNLDFFAKAKILAGVGVSPSIKFTKSTDGKRPGPVLLTFKKHGGSLYAEVLIQPNLVQS